MILEPNSRPARLALFVMIGVFAGTALAAYVLVAEAATLITST